MSAEVGAKDSKAFVSCVCCKPTYFSVFSFFQLLTVKKMICMHISFNQCAGDVPVDTVHASETLAV